MLGNLFTHSPFALTHADVLSAALAPDVVGHLEANDEDAHVQLVGALPEGVRAMICVQRCMLLRVEVGRVILVCSLSFTHLG